MSSFRDLYRDVPAAQGHCCTHPSAQRHSGHIVPTQEVLLGGEGSQALEH